MRKWLNWIALVLIFSVACGFLSNWQFNRRATKLAAIHLVQKNYEAEPVNLSSLTAHGKLILPKYSWRPVLISGHYLPEHTILVRDRPNDGNPGFEELVPFESNDLGVIFISRGWVPSGNKQDSPDNLAIPTNQETTVLGHLIAAEPKVDRTAPKGQIASIHIPLAIAASGIKTTFTNGYVRLISENPSVSDPLASMPAPSTDEGNNLSYALQWILFALMAAGALIWRIRRDRQIELGIEPKSRKTLADIDNEFEDSTTRAK